jgi:hypothetical protein
MTRGERRASHPHDYAKEIRDLEVLQQLVRDASRLLNEDLEKLSWGDDVKDWNRAAAPFVKR